MLKILDTLWASSMNELIEKAIAQAAAEGMTMMFTYGKGVESHHPNITVQVNGDSPATLIERDIRRALTAYYAAGIKAAVGPYPAAELTPEEQARDAALEEALKAKRDAIVASRDAEIAAKRSELDAMLAALPPMMRAQSAWEEEKTSCLALGDSPMAALFKRDRWRNDLFQFAEDWARLMQAQIANGKALADVAQDTMREADIVGISGNQLGVVLGLLERYWPHGQELRRWYASTHLGHAA